MIEGTGQPRPFAIAALGARQWPPQQRFIDTYDVRNLFRGFAVHDVVWVEAGGFGIKHERLNAEGACQQQTVAHRFQQVEADAFLRVGAGEVAVQREGFPRAADADPALMHGASIPP